MASGISRIYSVPQTDRQTDRQTDAMKLFLAGEHIVKNGSECRTWEGINILESYFYARNNAFVKRLIKNVGGFLLDSGAFSFMQRSSNIEIDWDGYIEEYADFITTMKINLFFELDIDSIIGYDEVLRLRRKLEKLTNKKPIPVWHKSRGKENFIKMCEEYDYVAIGGIVTREIPRHIYEKMFPWFIKTAHNHGSKIHGLGYTNVAGLHKYHFDSVDSTAWTAGNRGGFLYKFIPETGTMKQINSEDNRRLKPRAAAINNFKEWIKFCKYAEKYL